MYTRKYFDAFQSFCEDQCSYLTDLIRKFIPGTLRLKRNGSVCQIYICRKGMKREYLHVSNRPLGRELALKCWIDANRKDTLSERDLGRSFRKLLDSGPAETEKLRNNADFMRLLEESLSLLRKNGSFFTQAEWDDLIHGNVDAQFLRLSPEEYRRIAECGRRRRGANKIRPNESAGYPTMREDHHAAEILKALYRSENTAAENPIAGIRPDETVRQWLAENYPRNPYRRENLIHMTADGEKFRSKLEVHTAELLRRLGIPYRYEQRLILGNRAVYPDFILMHPVTHELIILEIFGMMSNAEYEAEAFDKINLYLRNHYRPGRTLLYYCEYEDQPLDFEKMKIDLEYLIRA